LTKSKLRKCTLFLAVFFVAFDEEPIIDAIFTQFEITMIKLRDRIGNIYQKNTG
jgi:hypothetical protein